MKKRETDKTQEINATDEAEAMLADLKGELDEAIEARKRALADFANFQRRAAENENRAALDGAARVIKPLLGVLDHFDLALDQKTDQVTVDQLLGGVRIVRDELFKVLESRGVSRIQPETGDDFDPSLHEAVLCQPVEGVPPHRVAMVLQPGYRMGETVLRPAKVGVTSAEDS